MDVQRLLTVVGSALGAVMLSAGCTADVRTVTTADGPDLVPTTSASTKTSAPGTGSHDAAPPCPDLGIGFTVIAQEASTVAGIREWKRAQMAKSILGLQPLMNQEILALPDDRAVMICVYRGPFPTPHPPGVPDADTAIYVMPDGGHPIMLAAGPGSSMATIGLTPSETARLP